MDGTRRFSDPAFRGSILPGWLAGAALLCLGAFIAPACAADAAADPCPKNTCPHSGGADQVSRLARESYGANYCGYYVGGGSACSIGCRRFQSESRCHEEGTFGMDYNPCWSRVALLWSHGRRHQSGHGQYETDKKNCGFPNWRR